MWSIVYSVKNKPSTIPLVLYTIYDCSYHCENIALNKYKCDCLDKNMKRIHMDYNKYCIEYWEYCADSSWALNIPIVNFYALYTIPTESTSDCYLELLKNYDADIVNYDHIDIWIFGTDAELDIIDMANNIKLINANK